MATQSSLKGEGLWVDLIPLWRAIRSSNSLIEVEGDEGIGTRGGEFKSALDTIGGSHKIGIRITIRRHTRRRRLKVRENSLKVTYAKMK